jgi:hypothetical protein
VRLILALILMVPMLASGAVVRLTDCGTLPGSISAGSPFDLDACNLQNGDDIALLLDDVVAQWGAVHLRAPSATRNVIYTGTQTFTGMAFTFVEDQSARNRLSIAHVPDDFDAKMWVLSNAPAITIGGPKLSMTFVGSHPGLGQGIPCSGTRESCTWLTQVGLIEVRLTNNENPDLLDFRANIWSTWGHGLYVNGGSTGSGDAGEATASRWKQANLAGLFFSSGVNIEAGVMDVWADPDRSVIMDPFNRGSGWDGVHAVTRGDGVKVGCTDTARAELRHMPTFGFQFIRNLSGGVTVEYGMPILNIFVPKYIGTASSPYLIRFRDYGFSGPNELTGYPSGIMVKNRVPGLMKNDPAPTFGFTEPFRFIRFHELPSKYGMGVQAGPIASGCAADNATNNNYHNAQAYIWMPEASRDGAGGPYINSYFHIEVQNISLWTDAPNWVNYFRSACESPDGASEPLDRCHNNTLFVRGGTEMPGVAPMLDHTTITGPGSWYTVASASIVTNPGGVTVNPINNTVRNTQVRNIIEIGANSTGTVIDNVNFTGSARAVITIGGGADVTVTDLCVPNGSTITGTGTLTYEGGAQSLPYTIPNDTQNCNIIEEGPPDPPGVP